MKRILLLLSFMALTFSQAQVSLVKDIHPGSASSMPTYENNRFEYNGSMYFGAYEDLTTRMELWKTDGTSIGTTLVANLGGNGFSGNPRDFLVWSNEIILIASRISGHLAVRTDGTTAGTFELPGIGSPNNFNNALVYNNELYLSRDELYKYSSLNGTPTMVADLAGGFASSANPVIVFGGELYFTILNTFNNAELWKTNGTLAGTSLVKSFGVPTSTQAGFPDNFTTYNGKLYFTVDGQIFTNDPAIGVELWESDGTASGTVMVQDLNVGAGSSNPSDFTLYNNELYFSATSSTLGRELFKVNASGNVVTVFDINPSGDSNPDNLFVTSNRLYYAANDGTNGREIWFTNTYSGATRVNTTAIFADINPTGDSNPSGFTTYFGEVYFNANNGSNGQELWKTNLTTSGTVLVQDINPTGDSDPRDFLVAGNQLFFTANNGVLGEELWKYQDASLSVNDMELNANISLFPNPARQEFSIKTNYTVENVSIYDLGGKTLKTFEGNLEVYSIKELDSGLYFVKISTNIGETSKKIIKE